MRPTSQAEIADALADASAARRTVTIHGAGLHRGYGPDSSADATAAARLGTEGLDRLISYEPAEMVVVVEAGMTVGALQAALGEGAQEWGVDAPSGATVGGVIAVALNSPRRLRLGPVRDSVLEVVMATGDGRIVKGGGRVVKNVTGYDLPRLAVGSLGTLGAITQVALKVRPLPKARRTLAYPTEAPLETGRRLLDAVPTPAGVLARPDRVQVLLEGWPDEVEEQTRLAAAIAGTPAATEGAHDANGGDRNEHSIEIGVPPSRLQSLLSSTNANWEAQLGVGLVLAHSQDPSALDALAERAAELGGHARRVAGDVTLSPPPLPAPAVQERLKRSFDPAGILPRMPGSGTAATATPDTSTPGTQGSA